MSSLSVFALDVGQGDCTFIVPPDGRHAVLFDCNDAYVAERFVADHGIDRITIVVSHLDNDHIAGLRPFVRWCLLEPEVEVDRVFVARDRLELGRRSEARELLKYLVSEHEAGRLELLAPHREEEPRPILRGDGWSIDLVLPWYARVLAANVCAPEKTNSVSAVLRVTRGGRAVVVGGDAPLVAWASLESGLRRADVVRTPHHGGLLDDEPSALTYEDLYQSIGPKLAIVSVGTWNGHKHPRAVHLDAIRSRSCRTSCTQLTPRCTENPERHRADALLRVGGVVYPYRHRTPDGTPSNSAHGARREVPCAGSVVVWLEADGSLEVEPAGGGWHEHFVHTLETPLCVDTD